MDSKSRYQADRLRRARDAAQSALLAFDERFGPTDAPLLREDRFEALTEVIETADEVEPWIDALEVWHCFHRRFGPNALPTPSESTIAAMYMTRNKGGVAEVTGRFVEAARREPFRLWEVQSVAGRESATLQCLTTRETVTVFDSALSVAANPWDIICGHIVGWDGVYVGSAVLPYALPAIYRPAIIKRLRKVKASSGAELLPLQNKVLNAYGQTLREMIDRAPPELRNTDNEELVWIRSRYRFAPKDQAALLQTLAGDQAMDAEPDESPDPGGVWHYSWGRDGTALGRTLLGQIRVGPDFLEFECNSRERREELVRRVVAKHAKALTLESSDATPMDRAMLEEQARSLANSPAPEARDLSGEPEVAKVIDSIHMRWVDGTVPALGGITPREAVKTAQGRQRVIDLLHEFENMDARARQSAYRFDYNRIRRELGLDEE